MDRKLQELLTRIFYEGHVVDFDFSKWDHFVRLVVVASAFPLQADQRFPLFNVDFSGVMEIRWKGNHIGIELAEPWHHCQWCTMEYECRQTGDGYEIQINDVGVASPTLIIHCKSVAVSRSVNDWVDEINPYWNRPYGPLARPSIEELAADM